MGTAVRSKALVMSATVMIAGLRSVRRKSAPTEPRSPTRAPICSTTFLSACSASKALRFSSRSAARAAAAAAAMAAASRSFASASSAASRATVAAAAAACSRASTVGEGERGEGGRQLGRRESCGSAAGRLRLLACIRSAADRGERSRGEVAGRGCRGEAGAVPEVARARAQARGYRCV